MAWESPARTMETQPKPTAVERKGELGGNARQAVDETHTNTHPQTQREDDARNTNTML